MGRIEGMAGVDSTTTWGPDKTMAAPQDSENAGRTGRMLVLLHGATDRLEKCIVALQNRVASCVVLAAETRPDPSGKVAADEQCSPLAREILDVARRIDGLGDDLCVLTQDIDL